MAGRRELLLLGEFHKCKFISRLSGKAGSIRLILHGMHRCWQDSPMLSGILMYSPTCFQERSE